MVKIGEGVGSISSEPIHGYVATALTGLEQDAKDAIDFAASKIAEVSKEYEIYVYQPRKVTDPVMNQDVEASVVYRLDRRRVVTADILFVIANKASFGVGQEIEIAGSLGIPTVLISREGTRISRMVTGGFANILEEITYRSPEDLERKLRKALSKNVARLREMKEQEQSHVSGSITDSLIRAREDGGYTFTEAARRIGISENLLQSIETHPLDFHNVGLSTLQRICNIYGVSLIEVLAGLPKTKPGEVRREDPSIRKLEEVGIKAGWNLRDYVDLRNEYEKELAASGAPPNVTPNDWVARHSALERCRLERTVISNDSREEEDGRPRLF